MGRLHPQTLTLRALGGLVLDRQGGEHGDGERLTHPAPLDGDDLGLHAVELDDELADHRGPTIGGDAELAGLLVADGAALEALPGGEELGRELVLVDHELTGLAEPGTGGDPDEVADAGELTMMPPTISCLRAVARFDTAAEALAAATEITDVPTILPRVIADGSGVRIALPGDPEYDAPSVAPDESINWMRNFDLRTTGLDTEHTA